MPYFGTRSQENLDTVHEDLQTVFNEVIAHFDCSIICGHRDHDAQIDAYNRGRSQVTWPNSKHNSSPSMAVDATPYPIDWNDISRFYYFGGFVIATAVYLRSVGVIDHEVRWGGDWDRDTEVNDQTFNDLAHFELI